MKNIISKSAETLQIVGPLPKFLTLMHYFQRYAPAELPLRTTFCGLYGEKNKKFSLHPLAYIFEST